MSNLRTAAQQALEALETVFMPHHPAVIALREALAEEALQRLTDANQEIESMIVDEGCFERGCACHDSRESPGVVVVKQPEQEPVAWRYLYSDGFWRFSNGERVNGCDLVEAQPLYTHPPRRAWQGLTEEEFWPMLEAEGRADRKPVEIIAALARAIEAALKERNA